MASALSDAGDPQEVRAAAPSKLKKIDSSPPSPVRFEEASIVVPFVSNSARARSLR